MTRTRAVAAKAGGRMLLGVLAVAGLLACRAEGSSSRPTGDRGSTSAALSAGDGDSGGADPSGSGSSRAGPSDATGSGHAGGADVHDPEAPEPTPREVTLAGHSLALRERDGRCIVEFVGAHAGTLVLEPRPPCYFVHDSKGVLQHRSYPDVGVDEVAAVVGSMADADDRARWNVSEALACGMQTQGVLVRGGGVSVSPNLLDRMLVCPTLGVDEIVLFELAHP